MENQPHSLDPFEYSPYPKGWYHFYFAYHATRSCHIVQSSPLDAFESVTLSSNLSDRFWGITIFYVFMYEYVPYLGWGLIRNPQVAKKDNVCV
jgi:hypothetical protein